MHTLTVKRELDHPAPSVWALVDDFAATWVHPIVEHSPLNGKNAGLGAQRECRMYEAAAKAGS